LILYLDTSVLVVALTHGAETERMQRWLDDQDQEPAPSIRDMGVGQFVP
jgi:predicted nucleic acid-binding protein